MSEFNYTEWMQQNKVGPYTKASLTEGGPGDEPADDYEPDTDADYEEPSDDFDMAEGNEDDEVDKVIQKYESVLLKALAMRSENPEDIDAHDAVKKVLETIASTLGLDSTIPFMEIEYFSGQYSPKEALEYAKEMFHDYKSEQGPIDEAGNIKGITIDIPGNSSAVDFGKAAARELMESFGPRDFRTFLQAFTDEISKLTSR